jgi:SAM-dependent methyltransferase
MHPRVRAFIELCSRTVPVPGPLYEFGSYQASSQEGISDLRPLFAGREYVGADMRPGPGVDVVLDLHQINLPDASVGTVICCETLEHVEFPRKAVSEIHRILAPDGVLIVTVPMNLLIHNYPSDYWRYTPEGLKSLLAEFKHVVVASAGDRDFPDSVAAAAFKGSLTPEQLKAYQHAFAGWERQWSGVLRHGWRSFIKLLIPPALLGLWRFVRHGRFWTRTD